MAGIKDNIVQTYGECHKITEEGELQKKCSIHNIYFSEEDPWMSCTEEYFYKTKNKTDGLGTWCKKCSSLKAQQWASENPERKRISDNKRRTLPENREYHHGKRKAASDAGYYKEYNKRPEVKARKYADKHRNHEISEKEWIHCKNFFKDKEGDQVCAYCGKKLQNHLINRDGIFKLGDFHKEHVHDKGANDLSNCIPSCRDCNSSKWSWGFEEWYKKQTFYTVYRYSKIILWITEGHKDYIEEKLPYRIIRKRNEGLTTYHYELWSIDSDRNNIECLDTKIRKKDLDLNLI